MSGALGVDLKSGWMAQYHQNTFDDQIIVGGYVTETGGDYQKASLSYVCSKGHPTFAFFPRGITFDETATADFKGGIGIQTFTFRVEDTPFGRMRTLPRDDAVALKALFLESANDLPFRMDQANGSFPSIGAEKVFNTIDAACAS